MDNFAETTLLTENIERENNFVENNFVLFHSEQEKREVKILIIEYRFT